MSEKRKGFIRFDNIDEFESYIKNLKIRRKIDGLQVHHMALPNYACFYKSKGATEDELVRTINLDYYGKSKGWSCIAQHFNIFPNGKITTGRDINKTPVGITGWNTNKICIEIYGDFDKNKENRLNTQVNNLFFAFQNSTLSIYRIHFASKNVNATHYRNNSFYYENSSFAKKYF